MSTKKIWARDNGQLFAEDDEGRVGLVPAGWDTGCPNCDYGKYEIEELKKDSLQKAWNWYCENFSGGRCRHCELKEELLVNIEGTSGWRGSKATEYPEDAERNRNAQQALMELHDYINKLPSDHDLFHYLLISIESDCYDDDVAREENDLIRTYGFQMPANPEMFVDELLNIYKSRLSDCTGALGK